MTIEVKLIFRLIWTNEIKLKLLVSIRKRDETSLHKKKSLKVMSSLCTSSSIVFFSYILYYEKFTRIHKYFQLQDENQLSTSKLLDRL